MYVFNEFINHDGPVSDITRILNLQQYLQLSMWNEAFVPHSTHAQNYSQQRTPCDPHETARSQAGSGLEAKFVA